ncbi:MBL fold metallo-hydrolase [Pradoshia sp.]
MQLTVIGFWGGFPAAGEASSGYLLEHDGFKLLLDCGSGVLSRLQTFVSPNELDAVLLTHSHPDHTADIGVLQHALLIGHMSGGKEKCLPIYTHSDDAVFTETLQYKSYTTWEPVKEGVTAQIGPFLVSAMKTAHSVPCFAYRIEAGGRVFGFTGDTAFKEEFAPFFQGAHVLLSECNFYKGMEAAGRAGHLTSEHAAVIARDAQAERLILTHLPHFGNVHQLKEEAAGFFDGEIGLASTGLTIEI